MRPLRLVVCALFALLSVLGACNNVGGTCTVTTSTGFTFCLDYGTRVTSSAANTDCSSAGGAYSGGACATANRVGRCTYLNNGVSLTAYFFAPLTDAQARSVCSTLGGGTGTYQSN